MVDQSARNWVRSAVSEVPCVRAIRRGTAWRKAELRDKTSRTLATTGSGVESPARSRPRFMLNSQYSEWKTPTRP